MSGMRERSRSISTQQDRERLAEIARNCVRTNQIDAAIEKLAKVNIDTLKNRHEVSKTPSYFYKPSK
ncbi:orph-L3 [Microplitis demolitor]|nr:orph-L3 [Microplitis demolitor]